MRLTSSSIAPEQKIDSRFTCDGSATSPQLSWSSEPAVTKSFALSCFDPDSPSGEFCHWLMINIPVSTHALAEGEPCPAAAMEIVNDYGYSHYGPPCPGTGNHRYVFTVYAVSTDHLENIDRANFKEKISAVTIDTASFLGYYERTR